MINIGIWIQIDFYAYDIIGIARRRNSNLLQNTVCCCENVMFTLFANLIHLPLDDDNCDWNVFCDLEDERRPGKLHY